MTASQPARTIPLEVEATDHASNRITDTHIGHSAKRLAVHCSGSTSRGKWDKIAILFVLPWLVYLAFFTVYPLYIALYGSVADWNILTDEMTFVGFVHYRQLFDDPEFFKAIRNSFVYLIVQVPASIIGGFLVALLAQQRRTQGPHGLPGHLLSACDCAGCGHGHRVAVDVRYAIRRHQLLPQLLWRRTQFRGLPVRWLSMPSIAFMKIWNDVGFYAVLFLAGLQGISREVLDAAEVDGVNDWQMAWTNQAAASESHCCLLHRHGHAVGIEHLHGAPADDGAAALAAAA